MTKINLDIDIVQLRSINVKAPNVLVGLPDVGLVGAISVSYVINKLKMEEIGYVDSRNFPPLVIVRESSVKNPIRIYCTDNLISVISDLPFPPFIINPFFKSLIEWIKALGPRTVIGITGLLTQNRIQINRPEVAAIATTAGARSLLDEAGIRLMSDGIFSGVYAGLIKECNIQNVPNITLFAESYANFPDPAASAEALSVVNKILRMNIDLKQLEEEAERIKISTRELMVLTERALAQVQKMQDGSIQAMYG
ncbi:MAG: PAC2 family protein [Nitrososphaerales archaeon]